MKSGFQNCFSRKAAVPAALRKLLIGLIVVASLGSSSLAWSDDGEPQGSDDPIAAKFLSELPDTILRGHVIRKVPNGVVYHDRGANDQVGYTVVTVALVTKDLPPPSQSAATAAAEIGTAIEAWKEQGASEFRGARFFRTERYPGTVGSVTFMRDPQYGDFVDSWVLLTSEYRILVNVTTNSEEDAKLAMLEIPNVFFGKVEFLEGGR